MIRISRLATAAAALAAAGTFAAPASAQYANEYLPPKMTHQGKTTHAIAGTGTVVVQVQVNANGTAKAIRVIHSSNSGDNSAAMDIANHSTYRPAHRGKKASPRITISRSSSKASRSRPTPFRPARPRKAASIDSLIRAGKYEPSQNASTAGAAGKSQRPDAELGAGRRKLFLEQLSRSRCGIRQSSKREQRVRKSRGAVVLAGRRQARAEQSAAGNRIR